VVKVENINVIILIEICYDFYRISAVLCFSVEESWSSGNTIKFTIKYFSGFEIGCVSSERYHKMCKMKTNIEDGIELLKSIVKPAPQWRQLLHMPPSKGTLLRR
jgi:hypothetical protein